MFLSAGRSLLNVIEYGISVISFKNIIEVYVSVLCSLQKPNVTEVGDGMTSSLLTPTCGVRLEVGILG